MIFSSINKKLQSNNITLILVLIGVGTIMSTVGVVYAANTYISDLVVTNVLTVKNGDAWWDNITMKSDGETNYITSLGDENGLLVQSEFGSIFLYSDGLHVTGDIHLLDGNIVSSASNNICIGNC